MKKYFLYLVFILLLSVMTFSQEINLIQDEGGWKVENDGQIYPIYGMVWSHTPIGENPSYVLWNQSDEFVKTTIDIDFSKMKDMGVTMVRSFDIIPPQWIEYIYDTYNITFAMNTYFGRYGVNVNGKWYPQTDYSMEDTRTLILDQTRDFVEQYKNVRGVAIFLLGNENNYGLEWKSNEIENLPVGEQHREKAKYLYSLFGEAVNMIHHATDKPVGIVNGDIQYLDLIAENIPNLDIFASNVYRGKRTYDPSNEYSTPFFSAIAEAIDKPVLLTEMGADAYNTITNTEAQYDQADYLKSQWQEIYEESYGKGASQNAIGGFVFEWMDEWWKKGFDTNLDVHDTEGSWVNGGYAYDFIPEKHDSHNNMNEEWFGINAQSTSYYNGYDVKINKRVPRAAYYMLADIWSIPIYEVSADEISSSFDSVSIGESLARASAQSSQEKSGIGAISDVVTLHPRLFGAARIHSDELIGDSDDRPLSYEQTVNLIGNITPNKDFGARFDLRFQYGALDKQFEVYNYSYDLSQQSSNDITNKYRLSAQVYGLSFLYEKELFDIAGYYHDGYKLGGHTDWVGQGDNFGLMQETFYYPKIDDKSSQAPFGVELRTKGKYLGGATIFAAPEAYEGARPSLFANYYREFNIMGYGLSIGAVHQEEITKDIVTNGDAASSNPESFNDPLARKSTLAFGVVMPSFFGIGLNADLAGLFSGSEWIGKEYRTGTTEKSASSFVYDVTQVSILDTFGGKVKLTADINLEGFPTTEIFGQYNYQGVVAEGGAIKRRDGSAIADNGAAGKHEVIAGASMFLGNFNIMLNSLWRTPILEPFEEELEDATGDIHRRYRDTVANDYANVNLTNRELLQFELMGTYDMTGATYFYNWDNDDREDALLATSLGLLYTVYQGETDPLTYTEADGVTKAQYQQGLDKVWGLYQLNARIVSNFAKAQRVILTGNIGTAQNTGAPSSGGFQSHTQTPENIFVQTYDLIVGNDSEFSVQESYGGTATYVFKQIQVGGKIQRRAWGQEDWHIEFGYKTPWEYGVNMAYHFDKVSVLNPKQMVFVDLTARNYTELVNAERRDVGSNSSVINALNPLGGNSEGNYDYNRFQLTLGYKLNF